MRQLSDQNQRPKKEVTPRELQRHSGHGPQCRQPHPLGRSMTGPGWGGCDDMAASPPTAGSGQMHPWTVPTGLHNLGFRQDSYRTRVVLSPK